jgi:hypothetical protein
VHEIPVVGPINEARPVAMPPDFRRWTVEVELKIAAALFSDVASEHGFVGLVVATIAGT